MWVADRHTRARIACKQCERYTEAFSREEVDDEALPLLTTDDLKHMGVFDPTHVAALSVALRKLPLPSWAVQEGGSPAQPPSTPAAEHGLVHAAAPSTFDEHDAAGATTATATAVEGTPGFLIDSFMAPAAAASRCRSWFLSHYSDSAANGLHKGWTGGMVWCTPVTAALLIGLKQLPLVRVRHLHPGEPTVVEGVTVTALDAPDASLTPGEEPSSAPAPALESVHGSARCVGVATPQASAVLSPSGFCEVHSQRYTPCSRSEVALKESRSHWRPASTTDVMILSWPCDASSAA